MFQRLNSHPDQHTARYKLRLLSAVILTICSPIIMAEDINIDGVWQFDNTVQGLCFGVVIGPITNSTTTTISTDAQGELRVLPNDVTTPIVTSGLVREGNTLRWSYTQGQSVYKETLVFSNDTINGTGVTYISGNEADCQINITTTGKRLSSAPSNGTPTPPPITTSPMLTPGKLIATGSFVEPNDSPAEATPIVINDRPIEQFFASASDEDWFEFYAKSGQKYTIDIQAATIGRLVKPAFEIYDSAGKLLMTSVGNTPSGQDIKLSLVAPTSALYRVRVFNQPPSAREIGSVSDYRYQLKVFLTDAPQQGIVKGFVLNSCNQQGLNQAEVAALLGNSVSDSTLSYKTGEYGLLLNPNSYQLKGSLPNFQSVQQAVTLSATDEAQAQLILTPATNCSTNSPSTTDPVQQAQQAVAVYDAQSGSLVVRDIVYADKVFYAEFYDTGNFQFQLQRTFEIPGVIHSQYANYSAVSKTLDIPTVFGLNKTWRVQLQVNAQGLLTVSKLDPL